MRKFFRVLFKTIFGLMIFLLLLVAAACAWLYWIAHSHEPRLDGVVLHAGIGHEVTVVRDDWGVPHITAENEPDAYFALGYVMAQDRLFQMETLRRLAQGRLAEILGPPMVKVDRIIRAFRLKPRADEYFSTPGRVPPELDAALDAYVAGINAFMDDGPLPFEFEVLGIPKEPFTKADCMCVGALLPITFADGMREDPLASMLKTKWPDKDIDQLFPGYSKEVPVTVMESLEEAEKYLKENGQSAAPTTEAPTPPPSSAPTSPPSSRPATPTVGKPSSRDFAEVSVKAVHDLLAPLQELSNQFGPALGSNSWVLGPSKTESGVPILANDPHIGFTNPSIWYEVHMKYGNYENYGFHFPPLPIALLGHNGDRGWALTMFANDDIDLYVEKFKPDDPSKVMYKGEWTDVTVTHETIHVRFGSDVTLDVRVTPHGSVITDFLEGAYAYDGPPVALSWVWQHVEYTDLMAFYGMAHARDYDTFAKSVALITSPGVNVSYADRFGNIAWWAAGKIVKRPPEMNPKQLLDGASGKDEILGYLPFEDNPHLKNPPWGYIVTANNMSTVKPLADGVKLQGYWQPGDRAGRIEQMLESREKWTLDGLKSVQFDNHAYAAPKILPDLIAVLHHATLDTVETDALHRIETWQYDHGPDSVGASIYQNFVDSILDMGVGDEIGEDLMPTFGTIADHWNFFKSFVNDSNSPFWDDVRTEKKETREDIVVSAFKDAVERLRKQFGSDTSRWTWGRMHTIEFRHPFGFVPGLGRIFDVGPFPASGGAQIVDNMLYQGGQHKYSVVAGPSTRRLIDFSRPDEAYVVLPTGNSGDFLSPHYGDQAPLFVRGGYRQAYMDADTIAIHAEHTMKFEPVSKSGAN